MSTSCDVIPEGVGAHEDGSGSTEVVLQVSVRHVLGDEAGGGTALTARSWEIGRMRKGGYPGSQGLRRGVIWWKGPRVWANNLQFVGSIIAS